MQIYEITRLNENVLGTALGAAASGAASALGVSGDVSAAFGSIGGGSSLSGYGDARQKAAAAAAKPLIAAMAKQEMQGWNAAVADQLKQKQVQSPAQLDTATRESLKRDLWNRLHKTFMQGQLGNNYIQSLPTSVDKRSQSAAKALVDKLNLATQAIMNFKQPAVTVEKQLEQWQNLSQTAYEAMSLTQFRPSTTNARARPTPKIKPNPDNSFNIGTQKLNPGDSVTAKIIQKIQAEQSATPGQTPEIKQDPDATYTLGRQKLNPRDPVDAKLIQIIQAAEQAEVGVPA